ncbi:PilZ domain-containing protein [Virgibacillus sp. JSM 102003]|uniref:PilZ domain-containing protein n=1 Tax=Virgibacillus sp. JSM 102003 TaxID=1562108 RepID=UPI0035C1A135
MYYKRNEAYRFVFNQPIEGKMTKREENSTVTANVHILDVSNEGAKINCKNVIDLKRDTKINLSFILESHTFHASGKIIWTKNFHHSSEVGLHLNTDNEYKDNMIKELKKIAKQNKKKN